MRRNLIGVLSIALSLVLWTFSANTLSNEKAALTAEQLESIGKKIFFNETGGNPEYLIAWNDGEAFASLGIGHFIWFPKDLDSPFTETFPSLLKHFEDSGLALPDWLTQSDDCPWQDKQAFIEAKSTPKFGQLSAILQNSFSLQIEFIHQRMQRALPKMLDDLSEPYQRELLTNRFNDLAETEVGMYSLIDYVNFKGEGISSKERYNGQGWGLKHVLLNMNTELDVNEAFAQSCIEVLTQRINNSPQKDVEMRWLQGWTARCNTYKS